MKLKVYQAKSEESIVCVEQLDGTYAPMSAFFPVEEPHLVWAMSKSRQYFTQLASEDNGELIGYLEDGRYEPVAEEE
jgi:hypothetical protein